MSLRTPPSIDGFGPGGFRIGGGWLRGSVLILDDVAQSFPPVKLAELVAEHLAPILDARDVVEFVLLGTGARTAPAPLSVKNRLFELGVGLEVASTPEACRLYNVLAAEGRRIAALLFAV